MMLIINKLIFTFKQNNESFYRDEHCFKAVEFDGKRILKGIIARG